MRRHQLIACFVRALFVGLLLVSVCAAQSDAVTETDREHWSYLPLGKPAVPEVRDEAWTRSPIDRFLLAGLEGEGIAPVADADPRVLVRRVYYDVVGLPPTPEESNAFVVAYEKSPEKAIAKLVDELLASRRHGERWGRHWLDVARYTDSDGEEADRDRPHAYHYRDFVIRAFTNDLPYDTFVKWQLAGDEYEPENPEAVAATGFLVAGPNTVFEIPAKEERIRVRYNELDDMVATIGTAFLATTIGCARCHDHKFDPVPTRDYYQLLNVVHSGDRKVIDLPGGKKDVKALVFRDYDGEPDRTWLFERADFYDRDEPLDLGFLTVLTRDRVPADYWRDARPRENARSDTTYQRRAFAEWITDTEHGAGALLARVFVNRVWQHHFGRGLVGTVGDFGIQGDEPSHPELLEWLAADFVEHGWRVRRLHRLILTSRTYRLAIARDEATAKRDADNAFYGRRSPRRLEAEAVRDAMLAVSGTLNDESFGPGFKPHIPEEAMTARNIKGPAYPPKVDDSPAVRRRSVYMFHKRVIPDPLLQAFDRPDLLQSCSERSVTTVAPQALALLNHDFVRRRAQDFARRLASELKSDDDRVDLAFQLAFGRPPTDDERETCTTFVADRTARRAERNDAGGDPAHLAWTDLCQTLFASNEFSYVD